jgi:hypothetical protein
MAKKRPSLFEKTTTGEEQPAEQPDRVKPRGIGLRESEWNRLEEIAGELSSNVHSLAQWALRDFIERYDAGDLPITQKPTLPPKR